jgi:ElaB/YqjD/DUF883 family membrane-anchored ribosome-binding protein
MIDKPESPSLTEDIKKLLYEAEQALGSDPGEAGEKFDELRERIRQTIDDGRFSLERMRTETVRRAKQADKVVRENPYYAIGIAAGVGAIIGAIVANRSSSSR